MDATLTDLRGQVCSALNSFTLRPAYKDEQRDLQGHIADVLRAAVLRDVEIITSTGPGTPKPSIHLCGTSFWPDVELRSGGMPLIGIEVKYVRSNQSASKAIAETLGQSLIYALRYPAVIAFVLHDGIYNTYTARANDKKLRERLSANGIELVLRRRATLSAAGDAQ